MGFVRLILERGGRNHPDWGAGEVDRSAGRALQLVRTDIERWLVRRVLFQNSAWYQNER